MYIFIDDALCNSIEESAKAYFTTANEQLQCLTCRAIFASSICCQHHPMPNVALHVKAKREMILSCLMQVQTAVETRRKVSTDVCKQLGVFRYWQTLHSRKIRSMASRTKHRSEMLRYLTVGVM